MDSRLPLGRSIATFLTCAVTMVADQGADRARPLRRPDRETIADPPRQADRWTPPATKLPGFLVNATATLFKAGMADPRGGEYREVEIAGERPITTRAFVLPVRAGHSRRFVVGWDGVLHPAVKLGAPADLDADVRALAESLTAAKDASNAPGGGGSIPGTGFVAENLYTDRFARDEQSVAASARSALKLCILLRLGRADLAETLFSAGTLWSPDFAGRDLTDYHIDLLRLASEWSAIVYRRLVWAHVEGDDVVAHEAARRLDTFRRAIETKAAAMGFQRPFAGTWGTAGPESYLTPLRDLDVLVADQTRRALEPPREPIRAQQADRATRIVALIRDFDQIHAVAIIRPGAPDLAGAQVVRQVIAEGDAAVAPLLAALVTDTRLTRSVSEGRSISVYPVTDAIYAALRRILKTNGFLPNGQDQAALQTPEGRKRLADAIRAYRERKPNAWLPALWTPSL